jgi:hypothetical protein
MSAIALPVALDPQKRPDAYAPTITPAAFDIASYHRDPVAYCSEAVPGRCWQVAQPSPTTPLLAVVGATAFSCPVGQSVVLRARTEPGAPLSITSFGLGVFPANGQTSISVQADAEGVASAEFGITTGTAGNVNLTAGSPVRAGTLQFLVHVVEGKLQP